MSLSVAGHTFRDSYLRSHLHQEQCRSAMHIPLTISDMNSSAQSLIRCSPESFVKCRLQLAKGRLGTRNKYIGMQAFH
eukprot:413311-Amphidinium_carterae.1